MCVCVCVCVCGRTPQALYNQKSILVHGKYISLAPCESLIIPTGPQAEILQPCLAAGVGRETTVKKTLSITTGENGLNSLSHPSSMLAG